VLFIARTREEVVVYVPSDTLFIWICASPNVSYPWCTPCFIFVCMKPRSTEQNGQYLIAQSIVTSNEWYIPLSTLTIIEKNCHRLPFRQSYLLVRIPVLPMSNAQLVIAMFKIRHFDAHRFLHVWSLSMDCTYALRTTSQLSWPTIICLQRPSTFVRRFQPFEGDIILFNSFLSTITNQSKSKGFVSRSLKTRDRFIVLLVAMIDSMVVITTLFVTCNQWMQLVTKMRFYSQCTAYIVSVLLRLSLSSMPFSYRLHLKQISVDDK
jgi:hypothetical protein